MDIDFNHTDLAPAPNFPGIAHNNNQDAVGVSPMRRSSASRSLGDP
jgi:hypothetical protein